MMMRARTPYPVGQLELEDDVMRQKVDTWAEMCRRGDSNLS